MRWLGLSRPNVGRILELCKRPLLLAWDRAAAQLRELAMSPALLGENGTVVIDPALQHHNCVLAAIAVALVGFVTAAVLRFMVAHISTRNPADVRQRSVTFAPVSVTVAVRTGTTADSAMENAVIYA